MRTIKKLVKKTKNNQIIERINKNLPTINDKYPNISFGGCGTFSYYLAQNLKDKYNINTEFIYIKDNRPENLWLDYDIHFTHIMIKLDNVFIDNNNVYNELPDYYQDYAPLPADKLKEMISTKWMWNNTFNHNDSNKLIKDINILI